MVKVERPKVPLTDILQAVCIQYNADPESIRSISKKRSNSDPRLMTYVIAFEFGYGPTEIGRILCRNHSTVVKGQQRMYGYIQVDSEIMLTYNSIKQKLPPCS